MQPNWVNGLKNLRRQQGWSLDKAARETGVSKAMLGQIERDESSPTLNTLWKIARGYELSFSQLLQLLAPADDWSEDNSFEPSGSQLTVTVRPLITYDAEMRAELLELQLRPGCLHDSEPHEAGVVEHVILIGGEASILTGNDWHRLVPGEAYRFQADVPHGYRNDSQNHIAVIHNLIFYPQGRKEA